MDQIRFKDRFHVADVRGMNNYPCKALGNVIKCDAGPCLDGEPCVYKEQGCDYFDAVRHAAASELPLTNYDFWFAHPELPGQPQGALGLFDLMICDEAADLPEKLGAAAGASFSPAEITLPSLSSIEEGIAWAHRKRDESFEMLSAPMLSHSQRRDLRSLLSRFSRLANANAETWAMEKEYGGALRFEPIDPSPYAEALLFRGIPKILLMGATVRPSTLAELGIAPADANLFEAPSPFPVDKRPIWWWEIGVRVNAKISESNLALWAARIDQAIRPRLGRKGIIHTMSYARAKYLREASAYSKHMILHGSEGTRRAVERFKQAAAPAILVSPVMHTGWDFPDEDARWQIIAKVPIPDTRFGIAAARKAHDGDWAVKRAIDTIMQITGRVNRSAQDLGETIIIDDMMQWLWSRYRSYFAAWWRQAFRHTVAPPPLLEIKP